MYTDIAKEIINFYTVPNIKFFTSTIDRIVRTFYETRFGFKFSNDCRYIESNHRIYMQYDDSNIEKPKLYLNQMMLHGDLKYVALMPYNYFMNCKINEAMDDIAAITIFMTQTELCNEHFIPRKILNMLAPEIIYIDIVNDLNQQLHLEKELTKDFIKKHFTNGLIKIDKCNQAKYDNEEVITLNATCDVKQFIMDDVDKIFSMIFEMLSEYNDKMHMLGSFTELYLDNSYFINDKIKEYVKLDEIDV